MRAKFSGSLLCLLFLFVISACTTVPHTGRSALHLISSEQLASSAALQFDELKQQTPISYNKHYNDMLQRVGERIAYVAAEDMPDADWEFVVFQDDSQINAFAMPGGKVAVYTGLFQVIRSDEDLAIVVGHEVAHVVAGHSAERVSQQIIATGGQLLAEYGTREMDQSEREMWLAAFGVGANYGLILPYSRLHESEADQIGLIYSARAGYDPRAAIPFWERMIAVQNGAPPEFLSTHPSGATRIRQIEAFMPEALEIYRNR